MLIQNYFMMQNEKALQIFPTIFNSQSLLKISGCLLKISNPLQVGSHLFKVSSRLLNSSGLLKISRPLKISCLLKFSS